MVGGPHRLQQQCKRHVMQISAHRAHLMYPLGWGGGSLQVASHLKSVCLCAGALDNSRSIMGCVR